MVKGRKAADALAIHPANQASWDDLMAVLGPARCHGKPCFCQRFKVRDRGWFTVDEEQLADNLRTQTHCGQPAAKHTSGLVAYLDDEPVGWCAIAPRLDHPNLILNRMLSAGRDEDLSDPDVWAATCFIIRKGYRGRGYTYALAQAAVDFARSRGARALEGYAMRTEPGKTITWVSCTSAATISSLPPASSRSASPANAASSCVLISRALVMFGANQRCHPEHCRHCENARRREPRAPKQSPTDSPKALCSLCLCG